MNIPLILFYAFGFVLLAVGDRYEKEIAANKAADAKYR